MNIPEWLTVQDERVLRVRKYSFVVKPALKCRPRTYTDSSLYPLPNEFKVAVSAKLFNFVDSFLPLLL